MAPLAFNGSTNQARWRLLLLLKPTCMPLYSRPPCMMHAEPPPGGSCHDSWGRRTRANHGIMMHVLIQFQSGPAVRNRSAPRWCCDHHDWARRFAKIMSLVNDDWMKLFYFTISFFTLFLLSSFQFIHRLILFLQFWSLILLKNIWNINFFCYGLLY